MGRQWSPSLDPTTQGMTTRGQGQRVHSRREVEMAQVLGKGERCPSRYQPVRRVSHTTPFSRLTSAGSRPVSASPSPKACSASMMSPSRMCSLIGGDTPHLRRKRSDRTRMADTFSDNKWQLLFNSQNPTSFQADECRMYFSMPNLWYWKTVSISVACTWCSRIPLWLGIDRPGQHAWISSWRCTLPHLVSTSWKNSRGNP